MSALARSVDRTVDIRQASFGVPKQPPCPGSQAEGCHADIMAKVRGERTMRDRLVKRTSLIDMPQSFGGLAQKEQGCAQETMPYHNRRCCLLLFGEFEELARERACCLALEG